MAGKASDDAVLVIGLGRFGGAVAEALLERGTQVLGIDRDGRNVQHWSGRLTHVVEADTTDLDALQQIGAGDFGKAVVSISSSLEASILTTANLADLKVPTIWSKAASISHGRILSRVGATNIVYPEHDMGERVAHLVTGRMIDYIEFDDGFALVKTRPPATLIGRSLDQSAVRTKYGVTVVSIKRPGEDFTYATAETVVHPDDMLIVAGRTDLAERFAGQT